jgi:hypothetical protein
MRILRGLRRDQACVYINHQWSSRVDPGVRGTRTGQLPHSGAGCRPRGVDCPQRRGCVLGQRIAVPWWSQSRHRQTTVSTDAIASMLINSVVSRQIVTVMVFLP